MSVHSVTTEETPEKDENPPVVRFLQGAKLLGQTPYVPGNTLVEHAKEAEVRIPTNCTSGTCGACMVTLLYGEVPLPETLPPGLDDYLVEEQAGV